MIPLLRCPRFCRWVSSVSVLSSVEKALRITLPISLPAPIAPQGDSSTVPVAEILIPGPVLIYNDFSHTHFFGTYPDTFSHGNNHIAREDFRVPQVCVEESLGVRRPEPVVTWRFR
ncbi:unnamed protein product [Tuber aestivum]|uniref:Uncharacterized protein n=1 Tax=Tuber aestivum TaxID=59557 RepID=A0A292PY91_9PEZI|nr:unnamed protein product [Tuber aestivum]